MELEYHIIASIAVGGSCLGSMCADAFKTTEPGGFPWFALGFLISVQTAYAILYYLIYKGA